MAANMHQTPFDGYESTLRYATTKDLSGFKGFKDWGFLISTTNTTDSTWEHYSYRPALPQHLAVYPYSQPTLPLGPFASMIGYPFLPQSYAYMPSGFQQAFVGDSTYHQQLTAILPQYKKQCFRQQFTSICGCSFRLFGNSTTIHGNYQVNQPASPTSSTLSYDDVPITKRTISCCLFSRCFCDERMLTSKNGITKRRNERKAAQVGNQTEAGADGWRRWIGAGPLARITQHQTNRGWRQWLGADALAPSIGAEHLCER